LPSSQASRAASLVSVDDLFVAESDHGQLDTASQFEKVVDLRKTGEFEQLAQTSKMIDDDTKKVKDYRCFLSRLNVHVVVHYQDVTIDYVTFNNCTTFMKEDKH